MAEKDIKKETQADNNAGIDINTDENMGGTTHLNDAVSEDTGVEKLQEEVAALKKVDAGAKL